MQEEKQRIEEMLRSLRPLKKDEKRAVGDRDRDEQRQKQAEEVEAVAEDQLLELRALQKPAPLDSFCVEISSLKSVKGRLRRETIAQKQLEEFKAKGMLESVLDF